MTDIGEASGSQIPECLEIEGCDIYNYIYIYIMIYMFIYLYSGQGAIGKEDSLSPPPLV